MSDESARIGRLHLQVLDANTPQKGARGAGRELGVLLQRKLSCWRPGLQKRLVSTQ